jgi:hypothetical protein
MAFERIILHGRGPEKILRMTARQNFRRLNACVLMWEREVGAARGITAVLARVVGLADAQAGQGWSRRRALPAECPW